MSTSGRVTHLDIDVDSLSIEAGQPNVVDQSQDFDFTSAHSIGNDSWKQVGVMLVTTFNCGFILSYSNLFFVPLSWKWGIMCLIFIGLYSAYATWLLLTFHIIDGKRFIRYRDLMGFVYGKNFYYITWISQFMTLILINMGFILIGGRAVKQIHSELSNSPLRLQYFIIVAGVAYFIFAYCIPTMSAMRTWLGVSGILTIVYVVGFLTQSIPDGRHNKDRNYDITGSKTDKVFNALGAVAAIIASNASGMVPEMQSTLRQPAVKNMKKAVILQFTVGISIYYGVAIVGYWAYGSSVSWYIPLNFTGPKWVKVMISVTTFLQFIVSQSMFAAPVHEALDTKFLKPDEKMHSRENAKRLFFLRAIFFTVNTFVAAAFPFVADFVGLIGSLMLVPLTFIFPSMIFLKVKWKTARTWEKIWQWFNLVFSILLAIATTVAAVRLIIKDVSMYSFFADN